tara:strand:- start:118 stop:972 length:855 start_codon:yes stop_codon:yes gene_type:complete
MKIYSLLRSYLVFDNKPKGYLHFLLLLIFRFFYDPKNRGITELFLKYSRYHVKDSKKKELFSLRSFGGNTKSRGLNFFTKEPETVEWISNFDPNSLFLDVGANVGIFSLYAGKLGHNVVAVEPESLNFALLNLNISDNLLNDNVIAFPICLNDKNKFDVLQLSELNWGKSGHNFQNQDKIIKKSDLINQGSFGATIDSFVKDLNFKPKYIKIDVDGNELLVLSGMKETLKSQICHSLLVEIESGTDTEKECINLLNSFNYKVISKKKVYEEGQSINYIFELNKQ